MRIPDYPSQDSDKWAQVDAWFSEKLAPEDSDLKYALVKTQLTVCRHMTYPLCREKCWLFSCKCHVPFVFSK